MAQTFKKYERLRSAKRIEMVVKQGYCLFVYPFRIVFLPASLSADTPAQVAFTVPKRIFRHAVDRNKIKRLTREAYRLQKNEFYQALNQHTIALHILFIYTGKQVEPAAFIFNRMQKALERIIKQVSDNQAN